MRKLKLSEIKKLNEIQLSQVVIMPQWCRSLLHSWFELWNDATRQRYAIFIYINFIRHMQPH